MLFINKKFIILQITPPDDLTLNLLSTEQLLITLHSLNKHKTVYSLEIASTRTSGICFLLRCSVNDLSTIKKIIQSFHPSIKIQEIDDYLSGNKNLYIKTLTLKLARHFSYNLKEQPHLAEHDPMMYITGQLTGLKEKEIVSVQYILSPMSSSNSIIHLTLNICAFFLLAPFTLLGWLIFQDKHDAFPLWLFRKGTLKEEKAKRQLFKVTIRLYAVQTSKQRLNDRMKGLLSAFASFRNENGQELRLKKSFLEKLPLVKMLYQFQLKHRLLALLHNPILSTTEVASLYHFPIAQQKTEDFIESMSNVLPAPLSLKQNDTLLDNVFAKNTYGETTTTIGLTQEERRRHIYMIGATGTGKTTLLATMIRKDLQNDKGLCVIDPHGNLIEQSLASIPKERIKDVVFFNPLDRAYPIGLNLLEMRKGLTGEQLEDEKDFITSSIISIFHKLYSAKYLGPRMEHILRFAILTALDTQNPTLFTVQKILTDDKYRAKIVATLKDLVVKDFWQKEFKKYGSYQQAEAVSPITNKLGRFLSSPLCRNILGQSHTTIDFAQVMNEGKILLCNLPKGRIGEDNSTFFGILIAAKIQLTALQRESLAEKKRKDFFLYIDEFQNFATSSFAQIMSEARKYRLNAILAHQTIAQIEDHDLVKVILANTGTILCFRTASPLDEEYLLPYFAPQVQKGEIANLPSYSFYIKANALSPQKTFSGETIPFTTKVNDKLVQEVIVYSQKNYGVPRAEVVKQFSDLYGKTDISEKKTKQTKTSEIRKRATMV